MRDALTMTLLTMIAVACIPAAALGGYYKGQAETYRMFISYQTATMDSLQTERETKHGK